MGSRILITGMSCATSAGLSKSKLRQTIQNRACTLTPEFGKIETCDIRNVGIIDRESPELGKYHIDQDSSFSTALMAFLLAQAFADASLPLPLREEEEIHLIVGSNFGYPLNYWELYNFRQKKSNNFDAPVLDDIFKLRFREDSLTRQIQKVFRCGVRKVCVSMQCTSSIMAILLAVSRIKREGIERMIVGGYDFFEPSFYWILRQSGLIDENVASPFGAAHRGFNFGDGAAFLVLESEEAAKKRGASRCYGEISGGAVNCYPGDGVPSITGITKTVEDTLKSAGMAPGDIDFISPHGCGIADMDYAESVALKRSFGPLIHGVPMAIFSPFTGYSFAASGYLDLIAILDGMQNGGIVAGFRPDSLDEVSDFNLYRDTIRPDSVKNILKIKMAYSGSVGGLVVSAFNL
jgi:3-oxoacyl-(acyl-carrier-protein) synthase